MSSNSIVPATFKLPKYPENRYYTPYIGYKETLITDMKFPVKTGLLIVSANAGC